MLHVSTEDRAKLVGLLAGLAELDTEDERREALIAAGLEPLLPKIDLSGSPETAIGRIVDHAARFGQITETKEAFVLLCTWAKTLVGVEQQKLIDDVLANAKPGHPETRDPHEPKAPIDSPEGRPWMSRRWLLAGIAGGV